MCVCDIYRKVVMMLAALVVAVMGLVRVVLEVSLLLEEMVEEVTVVKIRFRTLHSDRFES